MTLAARRLSRGHGSVGKAVMLPYPVALGALASCRIARTRMSVGLAAPPAHVGICYISPSSTSAGQLAPQECFEAPSPISWVMTKLLCCPYPVALGASDVSCIARTRISVGFAGPPAHVGSWDTPRS